MTLHELKHVNQCDPLHARVFLSSGFALTVWLDSAGTPAGCELVYDRERSAHAISRRPGSARINHFGVDEGDVRPGKPKRSPVSAPACQAVSHELLARFFEEADSLDLDIRSYVMATIAEALRPA
jgi:hypothetical protein